MPCTYTRRRLVLPHLYRRCGMLLNMKPYYYLLERGVEPVEAYRQTALQIMRNIEMRTWYRGQPLGNFGEDKVRPPTAGAMAH